MSSDPKSAVVFVWLEMVLVALQIVGGLIKLAT